MRSTSRYAQKVAQRLGHLDTRLFLAASVLAVWLRRRLRRRRPYNFEVRMQAAIAVAEAEAEMQSRLLAARSESI